MKLFNRIFATLTAGLIATTLALTAASFAPHFGSSADATVQVADVVSTATTANG